MEGVVYKSLSAVAKQITSSHCNGFLFFLLTEGVDLEASLHRSSCCPGCKDACNHMQPIKTQWLRY